MEGRRNIYLTTIPLAEALDRARGALDRESLLASETIPTHEALGRILSRAVWSRHSSPAFHSAAMDGIAVAAKSTFPAREGRPVNLERGRDYDPVNTGNAMPPGRDAVVMIEDVVQLGESTVAVEKPVFPWQHVRRLGEDIVAKELLFPRNHALSPYDLGALLAGGIYEVEVWRRPLMRIIPTGDELLDFLDRPDPGAGQAVESNSQVLAALARRAGWLAERVPPVPDDPEAIAAAVQQGLDSEAHMVLVCAGSSAGGKDYTRGVMERLGRVLVHGVAAMPGKPSLLGVAQGKLLAGVPGYPVSAVICFEELVAPIAAWLTRDTRPDRDVVEATMARSTPSKLGMEEFLRVTVGRVDERFVAAPLARGAANIGGMRRAQGWVRIPARSEGVEQNARVEVELIVPRQRLDQVLVAVGSHDNILDLLGDELMDLESPLRLASSHVGSMGGLAALGDNMAHLAGAHLFDPDTGDYNFPFFERHCPGVDIAVFNLAIRHQGLMVAPGNPKDIQGVADLVRKDVTFVNRQRGAGTRILLDYHLNLAGITAADVKGYGKEEYTHMAVAANVLTGAADCGLGIHAAAKALGLDFVPLARERYDLLIPERFLSDERLTELLFLVADKEFQAKIQAMGGYETTLSGRRMRPGDGLEAAIEA